MAFFTQNKFNYTTGVPDGNDVYPSVSSTWGDDGAGVLGNGTIAFPTAGGSAGQVLTDVAGNGTLTFADAPSTPPSGILGSVQLSDGAGGFTSDQPSFNYNSTTKRLGVGKVATTSLDVLEDSIGVNAFFENVSGSDFDTAVGLKLKHRTTIDMEATFGIAQEFYLEDDTSGELLAGSVGFERVDSDSERRYVVKGGTGAQELFHVTSDRKFTIEKGLRNTFGVDSLSGVSDDALAWNINDANAAAIIANAGSGIGLRVIANSGNILSLEDTNEVAQVLVSNTGLVTFNAEANATGDFEVLAETTGTALFVDVSEKKFAIGTGAATNPLTVVSDANGVPILANAKGTSTTSLFLAADYLHTTTANMADNFGTGFRFQIEDVAGVVNDIASVYARRDGADNEGKLELLAGTDGAEVGLTLNSDLVIDIAQNFSQITAITDSGAVNSFERTTTDTSLIRPTFRMLSETSGNMADGFGTGMFFVIKDNTVTEVISAIYATRDGADNLGKLSFRTGLDGDVENAVLDAAGTFTLEQGVVSLKETTTPTSVADYGRIYFKSDNKAYAQTGDGVEHEIAFV
jgi:hypothetical protein